MNDYIRKIIFATFQDKKLMVKFDARMYIKYF